MPQFVQPRVLIVDDDPKARRILKEVLDPLECSVEEATEGTSAIERLGDLDTPFDLVITNLQMPEADGFAVLRAALNQPRSPTVVAMTEPGEEGRAEDALRAGAADWVRKPLHNAEVTASVRHGLRLLCARREHDRLANALSLPESMRFVSTPMNRIAERVARLSSRDTHIVITGERGTGKTRLAEAIVRRSQRRQGPLIRMHSAFLTPHNPEALSAGFARTRGGTLVLEAIDELSTEIQEELSHLLKTNALDASIHSTTRVFATSRHDLRKDLRSFSKDVLVHFDAAYLHLPPLRDRKEDIPILAQSLASRFSDQFELSDEELPDDLVAQLLAHDWPGNIRELSNVLEGLLATRPQRRQSAARIVDIPTRDHVSLDARVAAYERGVILETLELCMGNRSAAARRLGIGRATLYEKLARHNIRKGEI